MYKVVLHKFLDKLFEPNQMELSPWDLYNVVNEDSKTHVFGLLLSQIWGPSSHKNEKIKTDN